MSSMSQNTFICLDLRIGSMLEVLVLKNAVECTSQRLKWTSGARVMVKVEVKVKVMVKSCLVGSMHSIRKAFAWNHDNTNDSLLKHLEPIWHFMQFTCLAIYDFGN